MGMGRAAEGIVAARRFPPPWSVEKRQCQFNFAFFAWSAVSANRLSGRPDDDPPLHLDAHRMNGDGPLLSLDPSADRVSYPPVVHAVSLDPNQKLSNASGAR